MKIGNVLAFSCISMFGTVIVLAEDTPAGSHQLLLENTASTNAVVLSDRIARRESSSLVLDAVHRDRLTREIGEVLMRIRSAYPDIKEISARPLHVPGMLHLGLEAALLMAVSDLVRDGESDISSKTGIEVFDELNTMLGLTGIRLFRHAGIAVMEYGALVNIEAACRAYREIPGVRYAEPEILLGDGSDIEMVKNQGTWYVIVRKAWGDCPSGCIYEQLHFFTVENGEVDRIETAQAVHKPNFAALLEARGWH